MKVKIIFISVLTLALLFSSVSAQAQMLTIDKILKQLTRPRLTSLQKLDLIKGYKGELIKGVGRVKDVLKKYGAEGGALAYVTKMYKGKKYEIVLTLSEESAKKIKKGKRVRFEGKLSGITYETFRIEDARITGKHGWWPF